MTVSIKGDIPLRSRADPDQPLLALWLEPASTTRYLSAGHRMAHVQRIGEESDLCPVEEILRSVMHTAFRQQVSVQSEQGRRFRPKGQASQHFSTSLVAAAHSSIPRTPKTTTKHKKKKRIFYIGCMSNKNTLVNLPAPIKRLASSSASLVAPYAASVPATRRVCVG
eukprot:869237-Rhodomonas_salina.2